MCSHFCRESLAERNLERWVESCRWDLLDHVIAVNDNHLRRPLSEQSATIRRTARYLGLGKGTPKPRVRSVASGRILSHERLGGLHHRYDRVACSHKPIRRPDPRAMEMEVGDFPFSTWFFCSGVLSFCRCPR